VTGCRTCGRPLFAGELEAQLCGQCLIHGAERMRNAYQALDVSKHRRLIPVAKLPLSPNANSLEVHLLERAGRLP
jgi:hypothetical protein